MDHTGRYPTTLPQGHKYVLVLCYYNSNYIIPVQTKSRTKEDYITAFRVVYDELKSRRFTAQLVRLDNEVSQDLVDAISEQNLDYQFVPAYNHRANPAEQAIYTFKAYFKAARAGCNSTYPSNCWDLLLPQVKLVMNLLRPSHINEAFSAYNQIHGVFNYDVTPIGLPGTRVCTFNKEGKTWDSKSFGGFYIGPSMKHYCSFQCYNPKTKAILDGCNTIAWIVKNNPVYKADPRVVQDAVNKLIMCVSNFPAVDGLSVSDATKLDTVTALQRLIQRTTTQPDRGNNCNTIVNNKDIPILYPIGMHVKKRFNGKYHYGKITSYDSKEGYYSILYNDSDGEEMDTHEVRQHCVIDLQTNTPTSTRRQYTQQEQPHCYLLRRLTKLTTNHSRFALVANILKNASDTHNVDLPNTKMIGFALVGGRISNKHLKSLQHGAT